MVFSRMSQAYPPLEGWDPFFDSQNFEESSYVLGQLIGPHKLVLLEDDSQAFSCRYYYSKLYQSHLVYSQWSGQQELTRTQPQDLYILYVPVVGKIEESINGSEFIDSSPHCAHLFSPDQLLKGYLPSLGQGISVCLSKPFVLAECEKLVGKPLTKNLDFSVPLDLNNTQGRSLRDLVWFLWDQSHQESVLIPQLEGVLVSGLLQNHLHTYTVDLRLSDQLIGTYRLQIAKDFILANLENPITVGDIAQAVETSARSLQRTFARYCGCTPKQFLTNARLDALRQELLQDISPQTITTLMNKYQLSSWGRVSKLYRERFGELPSQTLRQVSK
jgi:AraC-like DNA-binding protein